MGKCPEDMEKMSRSARYFMKVTAFFLEK